MPENKTFQQAKLILLFKSIAFIEYWELIHLTTEKENNTINTKTGTNRIGRTVAVKAQAGTQYQD